MESLQAEVRDLEARLADRDERLERLEAYVRSLAERADGDLGGWLAERLGYRLSVVVGLVVAIAGFWMMSRWRVDRAGQAVALPMV